MAKNDNRLEVLQALRAIAAALVVFVHSFETYADKVGPVGDVGLHYGLGGFGVKLFFCISGYIIFTSASALAPGWASTSFFARRRLIRIVPLYWCATLIYATKLSLQGNTPSLFELLCSLFFIPYADSNGLMRPVLGTGWTLNFEMLFYGALCLSLVLPSTRRLVAVTLAFLGLLAAKAMGWVASDAPAGVVSWGLLVDPLLLFFLAGMWTGVLSQRLAGRGGRFMPSTWRGGMALTLLLMFGFIALMNSLVPTGAALLAAELAISSLLLLVCVRPYTAAADGRGQTVRRLLVAAGDGSYSTYLIHGFVMGPAARLLSALHLEMDPVLFAAAMVLACTAVGMVVYQIFEKPLLGWMNSRWGRSSQPSRVST